MKVKVIERSFIEKEIDLEYPFYLYYQGDYCLSSEYVKVDEKKSLHINYEAVGVSISSKDTKPYEWWQIENNLIKEEEFEEILADVLSQFKQNNSILEGIIENLNSLKISSTHPDSRRTGDYRIGLDSAISEIAKLIKE